MASATDSHASAITRASPAVTAACWLPRCSTTTASRTRAEPGPADRLVAPAGISVIVVLAPKNDRPRPDSRSVVNSCTTPGGRFTRTISVIIISAYAAHATRSSAVSRTSSTGA